MANTTNFNWETPDDTDLVKDGAAAIRTLGSAIDTSLVDLKGGTTGQVLSKATNTDMDFTWIAQDDSNAIQNALVDAKGDIVAASAADTPARLAVGTDNQRLVAASGETTGLKYVSDTQNTVIDAKGDLLVGSAADTLARLAVGTNNQVLTADSSAATGLKWATPAGGGGKVLQVLQDDLVGAITSTSASYADTGLTQAITPSSATSKVLIIATMNSCAKGGANTQLGLRLLRDSTTISNASDGTGSNAGTGFHNWGTNSIVYLDSPATTSATTYKIQFANKAGSGNVYINDYQSANDCVSTITVMEIGA
jgi:hypothetical protein